MSESNQIKNIKKRIDHEAVKMIKRLYSKKFGWRMRRGRNKITPKQVGTPDMTDISEKTQKYSKEHMQAQEAEAMALDEDTPKYNCPMSQNDHQHQELMLQNDQHQELISEDPVTDYQFRDKIDRGENSGTTDFTQSQISEEIEEQTRNKGILEEPATDSKVGKVINEGENSNSPIDTNSQVSERREARKRNKRIRDNLDLGPSAKRNKYAGTQKPQSGVLQSECKKVKRKDRRRQLRTFGPATSSRNQKTHASDFKLQAKDPRTFSDAERGKHVNADNPTVNDDLWRTVMWALSFYGVLGYTWLSSSFAVQCVSIISVSMTGFGVHYFLNVKYSTDISDENPAPSPKEAPKKSSVKECEDTPPQFRDPYRVIGLR